MKSIKPIAAIVLSLVIVCLTGTCCFAAQENVVYSETISAESGATIDVPIYISGNTGLMGFAFEFEYDNSKIVPINVKRGSVLTSGLFDDSIGTGSNNSFKVIWSNTSNVTDDGLLFTITFSIADVSEESIVIHMSASQKDTFNEKWEKVTLNCQDVTINITSESAYMQEGQPSFLKRIMDFFKKIIEMFKRIFAF